MSNHNQLSDYLSIIDAAEVSGYREQYLRRMSRAGRLKATKIGHFWLIEKASLEAYMRLAHSSNDSRYGPREREKDEDD